MEWFCFSELWMKFLYPTGSSSRHPYHFKQKLAMVRFIVEMCLVASFMIMRAKPLSPYILPAMSFSHTMPF